jgi:uncharacterized protein YegL
VESLAASGGTNIDEALQKAAKLLDDHLHGFIGTPSSSAILLSNG